MNERQIDMSQRLYPGSYTFDASMFTPDMQSQIIKSSFDGGDTLHSLISERVREREAQMSPAEPKIEQSELEYLRKLGEFVKTPQFTSALAEVMRQSNPPAQPQPVQNTQALPSEPARTEPQFADPFAGLFANETPVNETQNVAPGQDTPRQNQPNADPSYEQFVQACAQEQVNPADVAKFLNERSPQDMILLYKEFKKAEAEQAGATQQQQQQQQPQHQISEPPRSIQNMPTPSQPAFNPSQYPRTRNPLWD